MNLRSILWGYSLLVCAAVAGCANPIYFPDHSMPTVAAATGAYRAYNVSRRDGAADFFLFVDANGRINRLGYETDTQGKVINVVDLDSLLCQQSRHLVIILDGFGYDVIKEYYDRGGLRMFYPPSKVVAPYPTLTDLSMEDLLNDMPCPGFEALYFDRRKNAFSGGASAYLAGTNEPYNRDLNYRANSILDAVGYIYPESVFRKELRDAKVVFDKRQTKEMIAYFVSSAGIGTRKGAAGQRAALAEVDRLVSQVLYETRGLTKITLTADHGHSYTPAKPIGLEKYLQGKGWRMAERLREPNDVAFVRFGLLTYAAFATQSPAALSKDLMAGEGVELASYTDGDAVMVLGRGVPGEPASTTQPNTSPASPLPAARVQAAAIRMKNGRYCDQMIDGDPLGLKDVLAGLKADAEGYYDPEDLMKASIDHYYPAAMERVWRAHYGLAENVPDVIVSLEDRFYSGSASFDGAVDIASTHGSLNRRNSTTFVMSTIGPLPPAMRSREVPFAIGQLMGERWPTRK